MKLCYWGQLRLALLPRLASLHWLRHLPSLYSLNVKHALKVVINTCLITCLSLLIWGTYPKINIGTDREPTYV